MYQRPDFAESDLSRLDALIARDGFATLVTVDADGLPFASHLPVLYARDRERILVEGHWARPNPQARHAGPALLVVHGPHAYISPGWYPDKAPAARVPTWNYAVAHLYGRLAPTEDAAELASIVDRLSRLHEARVGGDWRFEGDRDAHVQQLRGIVGFRLTVERVEMKFKLNQNHPAANVRAAADALQALGGEGNLAIAQMMRERAPDERTGDA